MGDGGAYRHGATDARRVWSCRHTAHPPSATSWTPSSLTSLYLENKPEMRTRALYGITGGLCGLGWLSGPLMNTWCVLSVTHGSGWLLESRASCSPAGCKRQPCGCRSPGSEALIWIFFQQCPWGGHWPCHRYSGENHPHREAKRPEQKTSGNRGMSNLPTHSVDGPKSWSPQAEYVLMRENSVLQRHLDLASF